MTCDCRAQLLHAATDLLKAADRPNHNKTFIHTRATAYAAAAGYLAHQEQQMTTMTTVTPEIERDRYGRPMVTPAGGGKKIPYRRCTTFVGVTEDLFNLQRWQQRMVAIGLADRPDLLLGVAAHRDDKDKLNQLCADATEAAKAHAAATTGTALHALTEIVDRGLDMPILPESAVADIDAYRKATACLDMVEIEQFGVLDSLKVGGTWDRLIRHDGELFIADVKTGGIDWGVSKIAMQLAVYAHCVPYDHTTGKRFEHPGPVNQDRGLIIHLPAGTATCNLVWVDIAAGWEGVQIAKQVWDWRGRKNLTTPFVASFPDLAGLIGIAASPEDVRALWAAHSDEWSDDLTEAAKARIAAITANVA